MSQWYDDGAGELVVWGGWDRRHGVVTIQITQGDSHGRVINKFELTDQQVTELIAELDHLRTLAEDRDYIPADEEPPRYDPVVRINVVNVEEGGWQFSGGTGRAATVDDDGTGKPGRVVLIEHEGETLAVSEDMLKRAWGETGLVERSGGVYMTEDGEIGLRGPFQLTDEEADEVARASYGEDWRAQEEGGCGDNSE